MKQASHILFMPPNWIGDAIMAQPAMATITRYYQQHGTRQISVHGRPWLQDLLPYLGLPGATYCADIPKADIAFLFPNSFRAALQCRQAGVTQIIGYRGQWRRCLLHRALPHRIDLKHEHHRGFYLDIARQLNIPVEQTEVVLSLPDDAIPSAHARMQQQGLQPERVICIAPGAQFGAAKCYPAEGFQQVVHALAEAGFQPLILGMPEDQAVGDRILDGITTPHWNAAGETRLNEALQLIAAARLMLCNDSGLMHVAAGLGIPTVTPFGATDPARTSPSGAHVDILYQPASCSPCLQRECTVEGHPCMANITPAMLIDHCLSMLQSSAA